MGLFKKKEEVPQLPRLPTLPELPSIPTVSTNDLPELPSFPSVPRNNLLNQEIVKSAVSDEVAEYESPEIPSSDVDIPQVTNFTVSQKRNSPLVTDLSKESSFEESSIPEPPRPKPLPKMNSPRFQEVKPLTETPVEKSYNSPREPIFVRIDKFQDAQKGFEEIKTKIKEIEIVLSKIKDVKSKEDEEIISWSENVQNLKSRLSEIDADIFSQI